MQEHEYKGFVVTVENVSGIYVWYVKTFPKKVLLEYDDDQLALKSAKNFIDTIWEYYQNPDIPV